MFGFGRERKKKSVMFSAELLPSEKLILKKLNYSKICKASKVFKLSKDDSKGLTSVELANVFVKASLLFSAIEFIREEVWLTNQEENQSYEMSLDKFFVDQLSSIKFLKGFLLEQGEKQLRHIQINSKKIVEDILEEILVDKNSIQKSFLIQCLKEMLIHFQEEESRDGRGMRLYRTFEKIDEIFQLDYQQDKNMLVDHETNERLYQGSGVNVQSGYSTILLAFEALNLKKGQIFIDLGSGYGRVPLVGALLRPDVNFIGYEYVDHRVESGNSASQKFGLEESLKFIAQDLSLDSFKVPVADIYYLYDPFSKETYEYVLNQIVDISKNRKIKIVTKGNAREWLMEIAQTNRWAEPILIDNANLCIFESS
jgi:hypothetical protein